MRIMIAAVGGLVLATLASAQSVDEMRAALANMPADYEPRTEHFDANGEPTHINSLIFETSPYLLQHAHNPVNWRPWGPEALDEAAATGKPIFLSIGYSTCHWCHVMERESFDNEEIAALMNRDFITIKVDREQRPDVDHIMMTALQLMENSGGWPLSAFLTPEGKPFYTGTYFPPETFTQLLGVIDTAWVNQNDGIMQYADELAFAVENFMSLSAEGQAVLDDAFVSAAVSRIMSNYDPVMGGFAIEPKFPNEPILSLFLEIARSDHEMAKGALDAVENTLVNIQAGGIHDHVGGGFHRYSVDAEWLVPHFEKMLYNQSQLGSLYIQVFQLTGREDFKRTATRLFDYVLREMQAEDGGFFSATDADNLARTGEVEEGEFFTWTRQELDALFGEDQAQAVSEILGVGPVSNFEGRNVLTLPTVPTSRELADADLMLSRMFDARQSRNAPLLDDKIIVAWNGPMIAALVEAGQALDRADYLAAANQATQSLSNSNFDEQTGAIRRIRLDGVVGQDLGKVDDYAGLILANLAAFDNQGALEDLERAIAIKDQMLARFQDADSGSFFMTEGTPVGLMARPREFYDGAQPSGNSMALEALVALWQRTGDLNIKAQADRAWAALSTNVEQSPRAYAAAMEAGLQLTRPAARSQRWGGGGKVQVVADRDDQTFTVGFRIAEGWHINAERLRQKDLIPTSIGGEDVTRLRWPRAKNYDARYAELYGGGAIRIFDGEFQVSGRILGQGPRVIQVTFQPCNDEICLAPETLDVLVPAQ